MNYVIIIIGILLLVLFIIGYHKYRKWYYLTYLKNKIFSQINNITLTKPINSEKYYQTMIAAAPRKLTQLEIIFLLKYKKFVDSPYTYSMSDPNKVMQTKKLVSDIISKNIEGCLIETGVWKGGMAMWMKCILDYYREKRQIWLFDTFEYFPKPVTNDKDIKIHGITQILFENMPNTNDVINNFKKFGLYDETIHLIKGNFIDTLPNVDPGKIAILRLDCDYYEPSYYVLELYYNKVTPGGYIIIDDYGNKHLSCKEAINDFRKKYDITSPIYDIQNESVYWIKN